MIDTPERAAAEPPALDLATARQALADEWRAANPTTPEEIAAFYREAKGYTADLAAWHATPERQAVTQMLVHVALSSAARTILDIGCGAAHDLRALRAAMPHAILHGVEPNWRLRELAHAGKDSPYAIHAAVEYAPVERADLLVCIDVLEHIPDPETFLGGIASRARIGCLLFESTATNDCGTPLHLPANRGWHPGRVLERHGWACVDKSDRVRVWRRVVQTGQGRASLLLCAYRNVNAETVSALLGIVGGDDGGWRVRIKTGDALIARSRAIVVTKWWQETADDVFLMVDDDIVFRPQDADRIVDLCRNGHDLICAGYPVHDGGHLAARFLPDQQPVHFGPGAEPLEIMYGATGFMAVHRRVIDALVADLPLCHPTEAWSFYPLFRTQIVEDETYRGPIWLSEDWGFFEMARRKDFKVWLDPTIMLTHLGQAGISVRNMAAMRDALKGV